MGSKKQRRRELARASARRRELRNAARRVRRRRIRVLSATLVAVVAVTALVVWIEAHRSETPGSQPAVDYDAVLVHQTPTAIAEVAR